MDPLAHTLAGATLAEAGLKRRSVLAAATLIVGANLPDVDAIAYFLSGDTALYWRRGWTHGVLAMLVLPAALAAVMYVAGRWWERRARTPHPAGPVRFGTLLRLAGLAVLSHPILDWMNAYGIRLLMPFSGRWFYGDALFIVDPWFWLLAAAGAVAAGTRTWLGIAGWLLVGAVTTALIVGGPTLPVPGRVAWVAGIAALVAMRVKGGGRLPAGRIARVMAAALALYVAGSALGTRLAEREVRHWLAAQRIDAVDVAPLPVAGDPFTRDVVVITAERYHFFALRWLARPRLRVSHPPIPIEAPNEIVRAALAAPAVRGLRTWLRFPAYEVREIGKGYRVTIKDVRFSRMRNAGIGYQEVDLNTDLTLKYPD